MNEFKNLPINDSRIENAVMSLLFFVEEFPNRPICRALDILTRKMNPAEAVAFAKLVETIDFKADYDDYVLNPVVCIPVMGVEEIESEEIVMTALPVSGFSDYYNVQNSQAA